MRLTTVPERAARMARDALTGRRLHSLWIPIILGSSVESLLLWLNLTGAASSWPDLAACYAVIFAIYAASLAIMGKASTGKGWRLFAVIFVFAVAFRVTMLASQPLLSADVFRYYWDGRVTAHGINPYLYPPGAAQLSPLIDSAWTQINHKDLWTPYPPFSQFVFFVTYLLWPSVTAFRLDSIVFDGLVIVVLYLILKRLNQPTLSVAAYAWSPLLIVEVGQSSHNDEMTVLLVSLSFLMVLLKRPMLSSFTLALASASKYYPLALAPLFFRQWKLKGILLYCGVVLLSYLPFLGAGWRIFNGMAYVANTYLFNSSVFPLLQWLMQLVGAGNPGQVAQYLTYLIFLSVLGAVLRKTLFTDMKPIDLWNYSFIVVGALLLLNRALYPWYLIWVVPYLCSIKSKAWILLTGTVMLGYLRYSTFPPPDFESVSPTISALIGVAEYLPFFLLLGYELVWKPRLWKRLKKAEGGLSSQKSGLDGTPLRVRQHQPHPPECGVSLGFEDANPAGPCTGVRDFYLRSRRSS